MFGSGSGDPAHYSKPVAGAPDFCGVPASEVVGQEERVRVRSARKHLATGPPCLLGILAEAAVPVRLHDLYRIVQYVADENCTVRAGLESDDRASRRVTWGGHEAQVLVNGVAAAPQHGLPGIVDRRNAVLVWVLIYKRATGVVLVWGVSQIQKFRGD